MATAFQYGLIAGLTGMAIIGSVVAVGNALEERFDGFPESETAEASYTPPPLSFPDSTSPILVMTPNGPIVECPLGMTFTPRARPATARQAASCEPPA